MVGGAVEKAKNFRGTWVMLLKYIRKSLPLVLLMLLCAVGGVVFQIIGPDQLRKLTNLIHNGIPEIEAVNGTLVIKSLGGAIDMGAILGIAVMLVCFYGAAFVLNLIHGLIMPFLSAFVTRRMRTQISRKINRLPMGYFNRAQFGDILSRIANDVDTIGQTLNQSIAALVTASTLFIGILVMMFITSWQMALVAIVSSIIGFVLLAVIMASSQKYFKQQQEELGDLNGYIEEIYAGHTVVTAYNAGPVTRKNFEKINRKLYTSGWKSNFFGGLMMPLMGFIGNGGYVAVCVAGAIFTMNGVIEIGVIAAFMIYIRLFTQPLSSFAQAAQNVQRTAAAAERVFEFLSEPEMEDESRKAESAPYLLQHAAGAIEFRNCHFGYEKDKPVIKDFSAKIEPGQKVAIVGPTGAGKTTIVNLLMRFFELDSGEIRIDGVNTRDLMREIVHDQFCMVLQDTWLFEGTIRDNIVYALDGVTDDQVVSACKTVGLDHIIRTLPAGYDTVLNDETTLSEGEKQLLTIARAVIKNAPLLILDEATSSVDTRTEALVQSAMDRLMSGRTSFVIAHRLSTIKNADIILVMQHGDIVESGRHTELLARGGFYAELYNSQFAEGDEAG
jgi:ATP-binding cassette subfamily B protein